MICSHCGRFIRDDSLTCDYCGTYLGKYSSTGERGSGSIRQGRGDAPQAHGTEDAAPMDQVYPKPVHRNSSIPRRSELRQSASAQNLQDLPHLDALPPKEASKENDKKTKRAPKHSRINWSLILVILITLGIASVAGYYYYMKSTDEGKHIRARKVILSTTEDDFRLLDIITIDTSVSEAQEELLEKWNEVPAEIYWDAGQDYLSYGDMTAAITAYRIADTIDPDNYDGLILLADAYELNSQADEAETIYLSLIEVIDPTRSEAYTALVNLYKSQEREQDAANLMQLAYQNTGKESFRMLRSDYIPATPVVDLSAGRYELNETGLRQTRTAEDGKTQLRITELIISSEAGFDVYYTTDENAKLPEEGILVERALDEEGNLGYVGLPIQEGTYTYRAVAVSGSLHSDELSASYTFYYPTPPAPYANLAPGTYKMLHDVSLRPGENKDTTLTKKELAERESHYVYYYTYDGSTPTTNSPKYDGTPIKLPTGRVTLKAICVNQFGKESAVLEVGYKFNVAPYLPKIYEEADTFADFTLNKTQLEEFTTTFGEPTNQLETSYYALEGMHLEYPWGHAVFILYGSAWQLVRVEMHKNISDGPRGTYIGMTEEELLGTFRDYGQPENADGTRGLYYTYPSIGQILLKEDGTRIVQYQLSTAASKTWKLDYYIEKGKVSKIIHYYVP